MPTLFLNADQATARLGVRRATLYSYVSRGLIRTKVDAGDPRARLYSSADIDALRQRKERTRRPVRAAATALDWGLPVLETRLSEIADGALRYRGADAVALAEAASLEDVATLLWGTPAVAFRSPGRAGRPTSAARATDRAIIALASLLPNDVVGLRSSAAIERAGQLVRGIATAATAAPLSDAPMHRALADAWSRPEAADVIRRALVLCADHELNASSFAVRVVASTGASLTNCLIAGLAALSGPAHGAATERVASFLDEVERAASPEAAVSARLERGEQVPGFAHPLYPAGDPRAHAILQALPPSPALAALIAAVEAATGGHPNVDLALVVVERTFRLPRGSALALFAIGRSVGWVAHAFEQQATGQLIRPRARFVG